MTSPLLIISGLDPTCGAGLAADIITARSLNVHPLAIPAVLTVQNSIEFSYTVPVEIEYIRDALQSLQDEFSITTMKIGLLPIENELWIDNFHRLISDNFEHIIIDPILKPTAGGIQQKPSPAYLSLLSGSNKIIIPNRKECDLLYTNFFPDTGNDKTTKEKMLLLHNVFESSWIVTHENEKHLISSVTDGNYNEIFFTNIETDREIHGTGCRFSSAVAAHISIEPNISTAIEAALSYMDITLSKLNLFHTDGQYFPH